MTNPISIPLNMATSVMNMVASNTPDALVARRDKASFQQRAKTYAEDAKQAAIEKRLRKNARRHEISFWSTQKLENGK